MLRPHDPRYLRGVRRQGVEEPRVRQEDVAGLAGELDHPDLDVADSSGFVEETAAIRQRRIHQVAEVGLTLQVPFHVLRPDPPVGVQEPMRACDDERPSAALRDGVEEREGLHAGKAPIRQAGKLTCQTVLGTVQEAAFGRVKST